MPEKRKCYDVRADPSRKIRDPLNVPPPRDVKAVPALVCALDQTTRRKRAGKNVCLIVQTLTINDEMKPRHGLGRPRNTTNARIEQNQVKVVRYRGVGLDCIGGVGRGLFENKGFWWTWRWLEILEI